MSESDLDERSDRLDRLAVAEKRNGLFAWRVDGWSPWRVTRHYVQRTVARYGLTRPPQNQAGRVISALAATARLIAILTFPPKVGIMLKTQRSGLRLAVGGRYRDVYFDGLLSAGDHHFKLEATDSPDFERQAGAALFPRHLNPVVFTFWGRVLGTLFPPRAGAFAARTSAILRDEVGVDIAERTLRMLISTVYWQARLYGLLLRRLRPRAVLVCNTGEYGFVLACRKAGVPIVELQHGVFDAAHPDAVPEEVDGAGLELVLPNVLAARSRYWVEQLAGTRQAAIAEPVGNELIDSARERRAVRQAELREHPVKRLVLSSQGMESERLADWMEDMIAAAPAGTAWSLAIKLHPTYDASTTAFDRFAAHPAVTVIPGGEQPNLFDLLSEADLHMSIASASLFDAAALGVPSLIIPLPGHEHVRSAVDGGLMRLAAGPADVWTMDSIPERSDSDRYAEPGFVQNMGRLLAGLNATR